MSGSFIFRHHVEPRVKLYSPREESFPIPLKYIDVSRTTHTNLDVKQEKRIDDYWNIDGSRDKSDSWTGFTQFTLLNEKPPDGYMWSGERLTKRQATSRPDHMWPELWAKLARNAKLREQKWTIEKPKLDNVRRLRRIYFIDPTEFKARMVRPVARLMISSLNLRVSWEPVNPQQCVWKNLYQIIMRTILQEGDNSVQHYNLVHKIFLCLKR